MNILTNKKSITFLFAFIFAGFFAVSFSANAAALPDVVTKDATNIAQSSAYLNGSVDPNDSSTNVWFEYGTTQSFGSFTPQVNQGSGDFSINFVSTVVGLQSNTTYYFRVAATNALGTIYGSTLSFTTERARDTGNNPVITTNSATNIAQNSATINGNINPNGSSANAWFEWGTSLSFGNTTASNNYGSGTSGVNYNFNLSNLSNNTTYYFRAVASNSFGTVYGSTMNFTTGGGGTIGSPIITTNAATGISQSVATLSGTVNPNGDNTDAWFEWGTTQSFGNTTSSSNYGSGTSATNYAYSLSNLSNNTTYYFRAVASNSFGTVYGSTFSFTTGSTAGGCQPTAATQFASFITQDSATLRGLVNPQGRQTSAWFEYGTSYALGIKTTTQDMGSSAIEADIVRYLSSLSPNTTYYYRVTGENVCDKAYGTILSFTTSAQTTGSLPSVTTLPATSISSGSAIINGTINPNGSNATAWFEWGTDASLSSYNIIPSTNVGSGTSTVPISGSPSPLYGGATYYFRVAAQNSSGFAKGSIFKFTTTGSSAASSGSAATSGSGVAAKLPEMTVDIEADKTRVSKEEKVEITVDYKNSNATAVNVLLRVTIPDNVILEDISRGVLSFENNVLSFDIGRVAAGSSGSVKLGMRVNDEARVGDRLEAKAELKYSGLSGTEMPIVRDTEIIEIEGAGGMFSAAALGFSFGGGSLGFYLLMALLLAAIGAVVYVRFKVSKMLKV